VKETGRRPDIDSGAPIGVGRNACRQIIWGLSEIDSEIGKGLLQLDTVLEAEGGEGGPTRWGKSETERGLLKNRAAGYAQSKVES